MEPHARRASWACSIDDDASQTVRPQANRACILFSFLASLGGGLHGYHNAIMSGISIRSDFLSEFFPELLKAPTPSSIYCQYNSPRLALVISSLFASSFIAESTGIPAYLSRRFGRTALMSVSGSLFLIASIIQTAASNVAMLILSRCFAGVGLSCSTVSVLLYLSEISPNKSRGKYNQAFQLQLTFNILLANAISFSVSSLNHGWRIITAIAILPALGFLISGLCLPNSPSSTLERGKLVKGRSNLLKIRSDDSASPVFRSEISQIFIAAEKARKCTEPWTLILHRSHRPELILVFLSTFFQQFTGINLVIFYGPQLFVQLGKSQRTAAALLVVVSFVNHISTYISWLLVDKIGRRKFLFFNGFIMFIGLIAIGVVLNTFSGHSSLPWLVLIFTCLFDIAYAMSWGPIGWLYPTEIQDLATRSAGITIASIVNVFLSFLLAQTGLNFICALKSGVFFFFAGWVIVMTTAVYYLFPETSQVPVEYSHQIFTNHRIWKRYQVN